MRNFKLQYLYLLFAYLDRAASDIIVDTKFGKIRGLQTSKSKIFYGIPYAQPPVGDLRWQNPQEASAWSPSVYEASLRKPGCSQAECDRVLPPIVCPKTGSIIFMNVVMSKKFLTTLNWNQCKNNFFFCTCSVSENCLFLNIWTPLAANASTSYPVLVFIHGGNFDGMSASSPLFDGEIMTYKGDIIVVTLDYRLGALGFLVTRDTLTGKGAKGNYGLLDQRLALKWINENIQSFGGNPKQVTVSGQSAGSQSISLHLMRKEDCQYFHRAIMESNPLSIPFRSRIEALYIGDLLSEKLGCRGGDLKCLKQKSADDIAQATEDVRSDPSSLKLLEFFEPWGPYVDGDVVPYEPLAAYQNGHFIDMPLIMGSLTEETRVYVYSAWSKPLSVADYNLAMGVTFPSQVKYVLEKYPASTSNKDQRDTLVQGATDFIFTCSTRNYTRYFVKRQNSPVFLYIFNHPFSFPGWGNLTFCNGHSCHGTELPYVFQSVSLGNFTMTPDEYKLSDSIIYYWSNFVKTGDPNKGHPVLLQWPEYTNASKWPYMLFETPTNEIRFNYRDDYCTFWDMIGYKA